MDERAGAAQNCFPKTWLMKDMHLHRVSCNTVKELNTDSSCHEQMMKVILARNFEEL